MMTIFRMSLATTVAFAVPVVAEEGMWLPSQAPALAQQMKAAGLALDPAALADLSAAPLNAIASLGGCSAAFLSPQGLVATNHHCVYGSIQYNSKPGQDYLTDGFLAAKRIGLEEMGADLRHSSLSLMLPFLAEEWAATRALRMASTSARGIPWSLPA